MTWIDWDCRIVSRYDISNATEQDRRCQLPTPDDSLVSALDVTNVGQELVENSAILHANCFMP